MERINTIDGLVSYVEKQNGKRPRLFLESEAQPIIERYIQDKKDNAKTKHRYLGAYDLQHAEYFFLEVHKLPDMSDTVFISRFITFIPEIWDKKGRPKPEMIYKMAFDSKNELLKMGEKDVLIITKKISDNRYRAFNASTDTALIVEGDIYGKEYKVSSEKFHNIRGGHDRYRLYVPSKDFAELTGLKI